MPPASIAKLNSEIVKFVGSAEMKEILGKQGTDSIADSPEQFAASLKREVDKWAAVLNTSGTRVE